MLRWFDDLLEKQESYISREREMIKMGIIWVGRSWKSRGSVRSSGEYRRSG